MEKIAIALSSVPTVSTYNFKHFIVVYLVISLTDIHVHVLFIHTIQYLSV